MQDGTCRGAESPAGVEIGLMAPKCPQGPRVEETSSAQKDREAYLETICLGQPDPSGTGRYSASRWDSRAGLGTGAVNSLWDSMCHEGRAQKKNAGSPVVTAQGTSSPEWAWHIRSQVAGMGSSCPRQGELWDPSCFL